MLGFIFGLISSVFGFVFRFITGTIGLTFRTVAGAVGLTFRLIMLPFRLLFKLITLPFGLISPWILAPALIILVSSIFIHFMYFHERMTLEEVPQKVEEIYHVTAAKVCDIMGDKDGKQKHKELAESLETRNNVKSELKEAEDTVTELKDKAGKQVKKTKDDVKEHAETLTDKAMHAYEDIKGYVAEKGVTGVYEDAKEFVLEKTAVAKDFVNEKTAGAKEAAKEKTADAKEAAKEKTADAKEAAKEKTAGAKEVAKEKTAEAKERINEKTADAKASGKPSEKSKAPEEDVEDQENVQPNRMGNERGTAHKRLSKAKNLEEKSGRSEPSNKILF